MPDMSWRDAVVRVLEENGETHYSEIAQLIIDRSYRSPENVGATPASTVASTISQLGGVVRRTRRGVYALVTPTDATTSAQQTPETPDAEAVNDNEVAEDRENMGLINAFGMFWRRGEVHWQGVNTRLLGVQQSGSQQVDFGQQAGVYILYDGDRVVYVGRVTEPRMGSRLREHTRDRLTGRWDRFSWFGVRPVTPEGELQPIPATGIDTVTLIATMEALLIEGLEPPQNRRQGDGFNAMEFIQKTDPDVELERKRAVLAELGRGLTG